MSVLLARRPEGSTRGRDMGVHTFVHTHHTTSIHTQAWVHYLPVKPDFSDLLDKVDLCEANLKWWVGGWVDGWVGG
jgi:hypothetical protein